MSNQVIRRVEVNQPRAQQTWQENWKVMKPFVHFAFKAMTIVVGALIGIIKLLPLLLEHKNQEPVKNDKITKI
jgi:hypothetical protein